MYQSQNKKLIRKVSLLMVLVLCLAFAAYSPGSSSTCSAQANRMALPCCNCDMGGPSPCYECGGCGLATIAREAQDRLAEENYMSLPSCSCGIDGIYPLPCHDYTGECGCGKGGNCGLIPDQPN